MAKKTKDEAPNPNSISNRDILQRLNFLYQAGVYLSTLPGEPSSRATPSSGRPQKRSKRKRNVKHDDIRKSRVSSFDLARTYIDTMKSVGQRTVVKMDPSVKRTLCKSCNSVLIPGTSATVRVKSSSSHGHIVTYTCSTCHTSRRIPAPPVLLAEPGISSQEQGGSSSQPGGEQPATGDDQTMNVLPERVQEHGESSPAKGKKGRRTVAPRLPPFFERDVGHVVFRGNEKLEEKSP
ncbi:Rpr2-domain-containing protein [Gloeophyllum trabeum ATCC 11539]|uniref:Rpr2-domain-containing protein n=1 Tax=Gloeophyllum trabeum (strain ATCC 11539 / FP-39264 / Madison 617) TaxID=670483 RepID=S7QAZ4_GLOTA|nr:Rpr2-domain-containing protein [Gloeophyllum trabeum ATCC 11539]EPQ57096.1 Rpr2-domain-containing protein [Gloeophyllum trabeum ATCC 11539]